MTLLTMLLLLVGMTSTSFVAPEGAGCVAYMDGTRAASAKATRKQGATDQREVEE